MEKVSIINRGYQGLIKNVTLQNCRMTMRAACRLCLLIIKANVIPAASHFTVLSLFNSYVIAHMKVLLSKKIICIVSDYARRRIISSPPSFMRTGQIKFAQSFAIAVTEIGLAIAEREMT